MTSQVNGRTLKPNERLGIYGQILPNPPTYNVMHCKIKSKDWYHPHPELEKYCKDNHSWKGMGEEYITCEYCRMKMGACID